MTPIDCVAVCTASNPLSSQEFRHGWARLRRQFTKDTLWLETNNTGEQALLQMLAGTPATLAMPDSARVLVLAHGHLLLTQSVLVRLSKALDADPGTTSAHAFDSNHPPFRAPDYCTLRGMERYLEELGTFSSTVEPTAEHNHEALVTLTTMGAVRAQQALARARWIDGAYVHDFSDYHGGRREEVLDLLAPGIRRLLDVGGGEGGFLDAAKVAIGCETHLAEYSSEACRRAANHVDKVWEGDFLTQPFTGLADHGNFAFDCITFLDVLEHANEPHDWLRRARALLSPNGTVVASIPNVGHWGVIADLLEGRWDYCPVGIHCVTHLRFFTEQTVRDLFSECGFTLEQVEYVKVPCPVHWAAHWAKTSMLEVQMASWDTYAFLVRARPFHDGFTP